MHTFLQQYVFLHKPPHVITFTPACFQPTYKMQVCCGMYKHSFHLVFWLKCVLKTVPHATFQLLRVGVYVFANPHYLT